MKNIMRMTNSEIDQVINEKVKGEMGRKIVHDRIIDGMTYLQILHRYFPQYDDYSDEAKQRAIRVIIKPIIEKVTKEEGRLMEHLKPCPFCGSKADTSFNVKFGYQAFCTNDDCFLNYVIMLDMRTEEDAINAWNRRANDGKAD